MGTRSKYTIRDERLMWQYLYEQLRAGNEAARVPKGNKIWESFDSNLLSGYKSASSLSTHFRKKMFPNFENAEVPVEQILYIAHKIGINLSANQRRILEHRFEVKIELDSWNIVTGFTYKDGRPGAELDLEDDVNASSDSEASFSFDDGEILCTVEPTEDKLSPQQQQRQEQNRRRPMQRALFPESNDSESPQGKKTLKRIIIDDEIDSDEQQQQNGYAAPLVERDSAVRAIDGNEQSEEVDTGRRLNKLFNMIAMDPNGADEPSCSHSKRSPIKCKKVDDNNNQRNGRNEGANSDHDITVTPKRRSTENGGYVLTRSHARQRSGQLERRDFDSTRNGGLSGSGIEEVTSARNDAERNEQHHARGIGRMLRRSTKIGVETLPNQRDLVVPTNNYNVGRNNSLLDSVWAQHQNKTDGSFDARSAVFHQNQEQKREDQVAKAKQKRRQAQQMQAAVLEKNHQRIASANRVRASVNANNGIGAFNDGIVRQTGTDESTLFESVRPTASGMQIPSPIRQLFSSGYRNYGVHHGSNIPPSRGPVYAQFTHQKPVHEQGANRVHKNYFTFQTERYSPLKKPPSAVGRNPSPLHPCIMPAVSLASPSHPRSPPQLAAKKTPTRDVRPPTAIPERPQQQKACQWLSVRKPSSVAVNHSNHPHQTKQVTSNSPFSRMSSPNTISESVSGLSYCFEQLPEQQRREVEQLYDLLQCDDFLQHPEKGLCIVMNNDPLAITENGEAGPSSSHTAVDTWQVKNITVPVKSAPGASISNGVTYRGDAEEANGVFDEIPLTKEQQDDAFLFSLVERISTDPTYQQLTGIEKLEILHVLERQRMKAEETDVDYREHLKEFCRKVELAGVNTRRKKKWVVKRKRC